MHEVRDKKKISQKKNHIMTIQEMVSLNDIKSYKSTANKSVVLHLNLIINLIVDCLITYLMCTNQIYQRKERKPFTIIDSVIIIVSGFRS